MGDDWDGFQDCLVVLRERSEAWRRGGKVGAVYGRVEYLHRLIIDVVVVIAFADRFVAVAVFVVILGLGWCISCIVLLTGFKAPTN